MKPDAVRGHLDGLILAVLEDGPRHGYAIIEALQARSGGRLDLPTGTVYPALRRLERAAQDAVEFVDVGADRIERDGHDVPAAGRRTASTTALNSVQSARWPVRACLPALVSVYVRRSRPPTVLQVPDSSAARSRRRSAG
jgi:hypothetical protein